MHYRLATSLYGGSRGIRTPATLIAEFKVQQCPHGFQARCLQPLDYAPMVPIQPVLCPRVNAAVNAQAGSALPLLHARADGGRTSHFSSGMETFCSWSSLRKANTVRLCVGGGPGGSRTRNNPVMSRALCRLNYWTV